MNFKIGDSVSVKKGIKDPDLGFDIGAWQGRISEVDIDDDLICIDWDSITLQQMQASTITQSEKEGWDHLPTWRQNCHFDQTQLVCLKR